SPQVLRHPAAVATAAAVRASSPVRRIPHHRFCPGRGDVAGGRLEVNLAMREESRNERRPTKKTRRPSPAGLSRAPGTPGPTRAAGTTVRVLLPRVRLGRLRLRPQVLQRLVELAVLERLLLLLGGRPL